MGLEQSASKYQGSDYTEYIFSTCIEDKKQAVPNWYLSGNHWMSIMHARFCMLCCPLNDHLYSYLQVIRLVALYTSHVTLRKTTNFLYWTALYVRLKELQCTMAQMIYILILHLDNTERSRRSTLRHIKLFKIIVLRLISSDVNYTKLMWCFCTDGYSCSIHSQCWYSWNTLVRKDWWCMCL